MKSVPSPGSPAQIASSSRGSSCISFSCSSLWALIFACNWAIRLVSSSLSWVLLPVAKTASGIAASSFISTTFSVSFSFISSLLLFLFRVVVFFVVSSAADSSTLTLRGLPRLGFTGSCISGASSSVFASVILFSSIPSPSSEVISAFSLKIGSSSVGVFFLMSKFSPSFPLTE